MAILDPTAVAESGADHFDPAEFDELITSSGTDANWRKAIRCPCVDPLTGRAKLDCPFCEHGLGVVWGTPVAIKVLLPGRTDQNRPDVAGDLEPGSSMMTLPSALTAAHGDRIDLLLAEIAIPDEVFIRGAVDKGGRSRERVRLDPVEAEQAVAIISDLLVTYNPGEHFSIDTEGAIIWVDGPPNDTQYTLRYRARPAYICWSPQTRDEGGQKMPYRVNVKRLDQLTPRSVEA